MTLSKMPPACRSLGRAVFGFLAAATLVGSVPAGAASSLERGLGKPVAEQLEEEIGLVRDPALSHWVESVGQRVVRADRRNPADFTFKILDADDVNAFAVPGGFVYVTLGLLRFVDSEDELAAVLGHEVAHVTAHHGLKQLQRDLLLTLGLTLVRGHVSDLVSTLGQLGGVLYALKHSRSDEAAADIGGLQKVACSGYDPAAMVAFLRKLNEQEKEKPSRLEVYFLTHPPTGERLARASSDPAVARRNVAVRLAVARGLAERGLYRQAASAYEEVLARQPEDAGLHLELARCWDELGERDRAAEERARARALGMEPAAVPPAPPASEPALAPQAEVAAAADSVARAQQRLSAERERRDRRSADVRRELGRRQREFARLLRTLSQVAARVRATDVARAELLHDVGLAVATTEKALGRVQATGEAGSRVTSALADVGEGLAARLRARRVNARLAALAARFDRDALRAAADLDAGIAGCTQALKGVDDAIRMCHVAGREMLESDPLPPPLLLTRFGQIRSRIQAAAGAAQSALETAEQAGRRADAAEARRQVLELDLLGECALPAQRPVLGVLLARRHGIPDAQAADLACPDSPLGSTAAGLLLGMAVRVRLNPSAPQSSESAPDPRPVKPLTIDEGLERNVPLAPLNVALRLFALDVAREIGPARLTGTRAGMGAAPR